MKETKRVELKENERIEITTPHGKVAVYASEIGKNNLVQLRGKTKVQSHDTDTPHRRNFIGYSSIPDRPLKDVVETWWVF